MADPPNPPDLAQAIAAILTLRDEQTTLLREIVQQGRASRPEQHHQPPIPGYEQFLSTQPQLFHKMDEPLDADSWLCRVLCALHLAHDKPCLCRVPCPLDTAHGKDVFKIFIIYSNYSINSYFHNFVTFFNLPKCLKN